MDKKELIEFLSDNLQIETEHLENDYVSIKLRLCGNLIDQDVICVR